MIIMSCYEKIKVSDSIMAKYYTSYLYEILKRA